MRNTISIKQLQSEDVPQLVPSILDLAAYHNSIPQPFSGIFPYLPVEVVVAAMSEQVRQDKAQVEAVYEESRIIGFSTACVEHNYGLLDYLFITEDRRGQGYGSMLMERALDFFRSRKVRLIDIKVVNGNRAANFYERYGFQVRSLVMSKICASQP